MRFGVYGRLQIEVVRSGNGWVVFRLGSGSRSPMTELPIPSELNEEDLPTYLDDLLHEYAEPGHHLRRLD